MDSLSPGGLAKEQFVDWSVAYARVESYFVSLRIENKLRLSQLVANILERAAERLKREPGASPSMIAMQEARQVQIEWFKSVVTAVGMSVEDIGAKGRLALFLSDMPRRWQNEFMHPGPWPEEFLEAFRTTYLKTGPEFQKSVMAPREINLGAVSAIADETWKAIARWPLLGTALVWAVYLAVLATVFLMAR